jgi:hypothetical protein
MFFSLGGTVAGVVSEVIPTLAIRSEQTARRRYFFMFKGNEAKKRPAS